MDIRNASAPRLPSHHRENGVHPRFDSSECIATHADFGLNCHHPRKRVIPVFQRPPAMESRRRSVLDTPLEPVIGLAEGETRWRSMTTVCEGMRAAPRPQPPVRTRLIFRVFCNVISPHKQGSFDFSRTRLAFFRDLPDQLRCPSYHRGMAAISGFAEQCRKMNAIRLGRPFGLSVHREQ